MIEEVEGLTFRGPDEVEPPLDPDPFTIGLAIFSAAAGGGAFLETRRQRQTVERGQHDALRAAFFRAQRTLIYFKRNIDEFETYILEEGFGRREFRIGSVRLYLDARSKQAIKGLRGRAFITANVIADNLDDLSEFLGQADQARVEAILTSLSELEFPQSYVEVVRTGRRASDLYQDLLADIDEREHFTDEDSRA